VINAGASRIIFSVHDDIEIPDIKCNYVGFFKPEYWNRAGSLPRTKKTFTFLNKYCRMPLSNFIIRADGKVPLCCNDYSNVVLQGDINKESIMDVWNNPINKKRRKNISKGILLDNICKKCTGMIK
jgi:radical SAM protein with 4Fe4S-binding SPASM domain